MSYQVIDVDNKGNIELSPFSIILLAMVFNVERCQALTTEVL